MIDAVVRGLAHGLPATAFAARARDALETLRLRAACVECNDDQAAALCAELHPDYGLETISVLIESSRRPDAPVPHELRHVDLVVTTPFHVGEVQELAARVGRPWVAATLRTDIFAEIARLLPRRPVYFVVTDPRYADKLRKIFLAAAGAEHLHVLIEGRDDVGQIPENSPTYVTRTARDRLGDCPLLRRIRPDPWVFSAESARHILSVIIIRANLAAATK